MTVPGKKQGARALSMNCSAVQCTTRLLLLLLHYDNSCCECERMSVGSDPPSSVSITNKLVLNSGVVVGKGGTLNYRCKWPKCTFTTIYRQNMNVHVCGKHFERQKTNAKGEGPNKFFEKFYKWTFHLQFSILLFTFYFIFAINLIFASFSFLPKKLKNSNLKPSKTQKLKPQTLKNSNPQTSKTQTLKNSNPQTSKTQTSNPQKLKNSNPQKLKNSKTQTSKTR